MYKILIDQDSTTYDLSTPWYAAHNRDYPDHDLRVEDVDGWDTSAICKRANCAADIYSYFTEPQVWQDGTVLGNSDQITKQWQKDLKNVELAFLTTTPNALAATYKLEWKEKYFPHIKPMMIVNDHVKHWVCGDILIDDGIHNLTNWQGIAILYSQYWNLTEDRFPRAKGNTDVEKWLDVDRLVRLAIKLLDDGLDHKTIQDILKT